MQLLQTNKTPAGYTGIGFIRSWRGGSPVLEGLRLSESEGRGGAEGRRPSDSEVSPGPGFVFGLVIVLLGKELDMAQASPSLLISILLVSRNSFNFSLQVQTRKQLETTMKHSILVNHVLSKELTCWSCWCLWSEPHIRHSWTVGPLNGWEDGDQESLENWELFHKQDRYNSYCHPQLCADQSK